MPLLETKPRRILTTVLVGIIVCANSLALAQDSDFEAVFTSPDRLRETACAAAVNWDEGDPSPLSPGQMALFDKAFRAASISDNQALRQLVTDDSYYRELYSFIDRLRPMVMSEAGVKFMVQQRFDQSIPLHARLGSNFSGAKPDTLVTIVWCLPDGGGAGVRHTGGYAYLSRIDGEWKFHSR